MVPDAGARDPPGAVRRRHLVLALPLALAAHHHRAVRAVLGADDLPPRRPARAVLRARLAHQAVRRRPGARLEGAHVATRSGDTVVVARRDDRSSAAVAGTAWAVNAPAYNAGVRRSQELRENPPACFGAAVCSTRRAQAPTSATRSCPRPGFAGVDRPTDEQCFVQLNDARPVSCTFGSDDPDAPRVALIGDSHAYQLLSTFQADGRRERLAARRRTSRAPARGTRRRSSTPGAFGAACTEWRDAVTAELADADLDAVFTAAIATTPYSSAGYPSSHDAAVAGYRDAWSEMLDRGSPGHHGRRQPGVGDRPEQVPAHARR